MTRLDGPRYTLEIREQGRLVSVEPIADPFITTTILPRGWRVLWAVLLRRYELAVRISADPQRTTEVMKLNHQRPTWPNDVETEASTSS